MKQGDKEPTNMKKTNKTFKANKIMRLQEWVQKYSDNNDEWFEIIGKQLPNGKWICEIEIPELNIDIKAISKTQSNAMLRAADKAYAVLIESIRDNTEIFRTIKKIKNFEMHIGENGEFISIEWSKKQNERDYKQRSKASSKTFEAVFKAIDKIGKVYGSTDNIVIHVVDKSNFPDNLDDQEIMNEAIVMIYKHYNGNVQGGCVIKDNLVIFVGYRIDSSKCSKEIAIMA